MRKRTRYEKGYRNIELAENGVFSTHLSKETSYLLDIYCKHTNKNKTRFVDDVVRKYLEKEIGELLFSHLYISELKERYENS